jgi:CRP-like cAMP-binding protein
MYSPVDLMTPYARLKQGDVFGETGLIKNQLRCSKAVCLEECELVKIDKNDFMRRLDGCDPLVRRLLDTMVGQSLKSERSVSHAGVAEAA